MQRNKKKGKKNKKKIRKKEEKNVYLKLKEWHVIEFSLDLKNIYIQIRKYLFLI